MDSVTNSTSDIQAHSLLSPSLIESFTWRDLDDEDSSSLGSSSSKSSYGGDDDSDFDMDIMDDSSDSGREAGEGNVAKA